MNATLRATVALLAVLSLVSCGADPAPRQEDPAARPEDPAPKTVTVAAAPDSGAAWAGYEKESTEELRERLSSLQFRVTQEEGTERPFQNEYWDNKAAGIYVDVVSGEPLFSSLDKFKSGTGWPSFTRPLIPENVSEHTDRKLGYPRSEVRSLHADSHLGHVFPDGPEPTGLRYCINSAALRFVPVASLADEGYEELAPAFEPSGDSAPE